VPKPAASVTASGVRTRLRFEHGRAVARRDNHTLTVDDRSGA
jgi:hypothetical protein